MTTMSSPGEMPHKRPGRRPISDFNAIELMLRLEAIYAASGNPRGVRALANEVVERVNVIGASCEAAADRLRRKFRSMRREQAEFSPIKSQAPKPELRHLSMDEAEAIGMHTGLERETGLETAPSVEATAVHTESLRAHRASARIIERPAEARQRGGPRHLVSIRISSGSESVELRLKVGVVHELMAALSAALVELEERRGTAVAD